MIDLIKQAEEFFRAGIDYDEDDPRFVLRDLVYEYKRLRVAYYAVVAENESLRLEVNELKSEVASKDGLISFI